MRHIARPVWESGKSQSDFFCQAKSKLGQLFAKYSLTNWCVESFFFVFVSFLFFSFSLCHIFKILMTLRMTHNVRKEVKNQGIHLFFSKVLLSSVGQLEEPSASADSNKSSTGKEVTYRMFGVFPNTISRKCWCSTLMCIFLLLYLCM